MKSFQFLFITLAAAFMLSGCGESREERAARAEAERDRLMLIEMQRRENEQREADRIQRNIDNSVQVLDILTR